MALNMSYSSITSAPANDFNAELKKVWSLPTHELAKWTTEQDPKLWLSRVQKSASERYKAAKKRKQAELLPKIKEAQASKDKEIVKKQKKRTDNHASAVASRERHNFQVNVLEGCLSECIRIMAKVGKDVLAKSEDYDRVTEENDRLRRELNFGKRHFVPPDSFTGGSRSVSYGNDAYGQLYAEGNVEPDNGNEINPSCDVNTVTAPSSIVTTQDDVRLGASGHSESLHHSPAASAAHAMASFPADPSNEETNVTMRDAPESVPITGATTDMSGMLDLLTKVSAAHLGWNNVFQEGDIAPTSTGPLFLDGDLLPNNPMTSVDDLSGITGMSSLLTPVGTNFANAKNLVRSEQEIDDPATTSIVENDGDSNSSPTDGPTLISKDWFAPKMGPISVTAHDNYKDLQQKLQETKPGFSDFNLGA